MDPSDSILAACQETIGYKFCNIGLLRQSLMHASATGNRIESNERLEFLGDAILGMVICHELFIRFPRYLEGELTKIKSMVVSRRTCTRIAKNIGLGQFLCVGKGMGGLAKLPSSCTAAVLEAIIGAIYIDGGDAAARSFILRHMGYLLDQADASQHQNNFKSMLQQHAQRIMDATPIYEMLDEKGPDHSKCFEVGVLIGSRRFASAWGTSKKDAEQLAAYYALQELKLLAGDAKMPDTAVG